MLNFTSCAFSLIFLVKGMDQQWTLFPSPCIYYCCIVLRDKSKHTCKKWKKMFWIYSMFDNFIGNQFRLINIYIKKYFFNFLTKNNSVEVGMLLLGIGCFYI